MPDFIEPTPGAPDGFPFAEKIARQKAGLGEEDFRALRGKHLRKDVDFVYHLKAVYLTAVALQKIAPQLTPVASNAPPGGIPSRESAMPSAPVKLLIVRNDLPNRRLLLACATGEDPDRPKKTVRVRVKSQEGFRIRTQIEARLVAGYTDMYDLTSKYPRKKPAA